MLNVYGRPDVFGGMLAVNDTPVDPGDSLMEILRPGSVKLVGYRAEPAQWYQDLAATLPVTAPGQPIRVWTNLEAGGIRFIQPTNADFAPVSRLWPRTGRHNLFNRQTEVPTVGASWGVTGGTMVDGILTENTASSAHNTFALGSNNAWSPNLPIGVRVYLSMWVKAEADTTVAQIAFGATYFGTGSFVNFDLVSGEVSATGCNASMVPEAGGWRLKADAVTTATAASGAPFALCLADNNFAAGRVPAYAGMGRQLEWGKVQVALSDRPYQNVISANEVYQAGVPPIWWAYFDGVDDWMQSETPLDLTGSDQVSVFAGARKLSDAAQGTLVEFSPNAPLAANRGSFLLRAPQIPAQLDYQFFCYGEEGGASAGSGSGSLPAPDAAVITGLGNLSGAVSFRANGTLRATSSPAMGGGVFKEDTLYIGRRGGLSLPLNGMVQSLAVRGGPIPDVTTIEAAEANINERLGAY